MTRTEDAVEQRPRATAMPRCAITAAMRRFSMHANSLAMTMKMYMLMRTADVFFDMHESFDDDAALARR